MNENNPFTAYISCPAKQLFLFVVCSFILNLDVLTKLLLLVPQAILL